jgi:hypothetical protein
MNSVETVKVEYNNKISTAIQLILKKIKSTCTYRVFTKRGVKALPHFNTRSYPAYLIDEIDNR